MTTTNDLFGFVQPKPIFVDIRNQRDSVAEKKAVLCKLLLEAVRVVPFGICNADVKTVREWRNCCDNAKKTLSNKRSTVNDLEVSLKQMQSYR